jgi:hypothetical protein
LLTTVNERLALFKLPAYIQPSVVEKRTAHPFLKALFDGLPVKRVYKDQVTFFFKDEGDLVATLKKVIERHELENGEQG